MNSRVWTIPTSITAAVAVVFMTASLSATPDNETPGQSQKRADAAPNDSPAVTIDEARERAKLMHDIYAATLETMHRHYFENERAMVPARAMQDIFRKIERKSHVAGRWISVNTKPMNIDHKPQTDFEKLAAATLGDRKDSLETVEEGVYRRAGTIRLSGECLGCHQPNTADRTRDRFAALIISIPIRKK